MAVVTDALRIGPFRRLWLVLGLSAIGDWLGLLASATFAAAQVSGEAAKGLAFGSVVAVQLLPALLLGPLAGTLADRFDRRFVMASIDVCRFVLFASIPLVGIMVDSPAVVVTWTAVAMFAIQAAAMLWVPAKEAAVPNLLPRSMLEPANQVTLATTYGIAPVAAGLLFSAMERITWIGSAAAGVALFLNALTFLASALVVLLGIKEISRRTESIAARVRRDGVLSELAAANRYLYTDRLVRGLVVGILGAFAGAGIVIGSAKFYARALGGGDATFALLFALLFAGFGVGVIGGPRLVGQLSRRRSFGLSIVLAGTGALTLGVAPSLGHSLTVAAFGAVVVGAGGGMAFLCGITFLGTEVGDSMRGKVFAFVQTTARAMLIVTISVSGLLIGAGYSARLLLAAAGVSGVLVGALALRSMDDRRGVPLWKDVWHNVLRTRSWLN